MITTVNRYIILYGKVITFTSKLDYYFNVKNICTANWSTFAPMAITCTIWGEVGSCYVRL